MSLLLLDVGSQDSLGGGSNFNILLESGDDILAENNDFLILEEAP